MKILYITTAPIDYNSSANIRNTSLIKGFCGAGHSVDCMYVQPVYEVESEANLTSGIDIKNRYIIKISGLHSSVINSAKKNRFLSSMKIAAYKIYTSLKIYDSRENEVCNVSKLNIDEKYDAIISSSDPKSAHLFAEELIRLHPGIAKKWIQYWGDPFSGDINCKNKIKKSKIVKEEKRLLSLCDKAVYVSPFTADYIRKKHPEYADKIEFLPVPYREEKIMQRPDNNMLTLGYFGDYNGDRDVTKLVDAVSETDGVKMYLIGNGDESIVKSDNIEAHSRMGVAELSKYENQCDIICCVLNKSGTQIPGKLYHAAATDKPVLVVLDGDKKEQIKEYLDGFDRYIFAENNKDDIKNMLLQLKNNIPTAQPCKKLSAEYIAKQFEEIMK